MKISKIRSKPRQSAILRSMLLLLVLVVLLLLGQNQRPSYRLLQSSQSIKFTTANPSVRKRSHPFTFVFPSVDERVRYYMGSWYDDTNTTLQKIFKQQCCPRYYTEKERSAHHKPFLFDRTNSHLPSTRRYGQDNLEYIFNKTSNYNMNVDDMVMLEVFGDTSLHANLPLLQKARFAVSMPTDWSVAYQPNIADWDAPVDYYDEVGTSLAAEFIGRPVPPIGMLTIQRHFGNLKEIPTVDTLSWEEKEPTLFWRGAATGRHRVEIMSQFSSADPTKYNIDVGFVAPVDPSEVSNHGLPFKQTATLQEQLRYKYLLSIEGNDVASGLKWMLLADVVVFMSPPTRTTWAMEDWLVPYYHYIPIMANGSDLPEKVAWAQNHDDECRDISKHATEFMQNVFASEEAKENNRLIMQRMLSRYQAQYGEWLSNCREKDPGYRQMITATSVGTM